MTQILPPCAGEDDAIVVEDGEEGPVDADLADLYGVDVGALNQAVARNADRFPSDFMLKLTAKEVASLRSQSVILDGEDDIFDSHSVDDICEERTMRSWQ